VSGLAGLGVLVTRPVQQAQTLCQLLQQAGAVVHRLPLQAIEPLGEDAALAARLRQARGWDHWIFTSANAAREALRFDAGPWPDLAAAGAATAEALAQGGRAAAVPAGVDGSAGLLADPRFAAPSGRRILIVTGENTLPALAAGLRARGAEVEELAVYRRVPLHPAPQAVADAVLASQAAIVANGETLAQLLLLTPAPARPHLLSLQLALPSPRMIEKAREAGFTQAPLLPARVSDAAYVELLERWHQRQK
jgi:uroporphyrinogen-III synthase